jgi:hypothetical protein
MKPEILPNGRDNGHGNGPVPLPRIILSAETGSVSVNNGQSIAVEFTAERVDTEAAISLSAVRLPQGVTAAFSPASLPASSVAQKFIMTLTASPNAVTAESAVQVVAAAPAAESASAIVTVTVVSPFSFISGAPILPIGSSGQSTASGQTAVVLAAFGKAATAFNLQILAGVTGTISFSVTGAAPAGISAQFSPLSLNAPPGPGFIATTVTLTAGASISPGTSSVGCEVMVDSAARGVFTFPLQLVAPFVSSVSPRTGSVPAFVNPGAPVTITGGGFGPGTTVAFGADAPVAAASIAGNGTSLTVTVPATGASGQLQVVSPAGVASGAPDFAVDNYRNTRGFSWVNSDSFQSMVGGSYSKADATALFGESATYIDVLGIKFFDPLVDAFLDLADALLDAGGQCFGMSLGSLRFDAGQMGFGGLPQQPANAEPNGPAGPDAWLLDGPALGDGSNVSPTLAAFVHQQHLAQLSQESINNWIGFHASVTSAAGLRSALQRAFTAGGTSGQGAIVCMNPSVSEGHAVVAYDIADREGGAFDILVYNPNVPFQPSEDANSEIRASQASQSVINVMSNGTWTFSEFGWTGGIFNITVVPWNTIPARPTLPWVELVTVALAAAVIWLVVGDAAVSQVSDGQGHLLLAQGQWNVNPATMLPGVRPLPAFGGLGRSLPPSFVSTNPGTLTSTVSGNAEGAYDLHWVGNGYAASMTGVPATPEADDSVQALAGEVNFTPAQSKTVTAAITGIGTPSGLPRTATVQTDASAGAPVRLGFDKAAETFTYVNEGAAASYTLELSTIDATGQPVRFAAPPASTRPGDTLTFKPDWRQPGAGTGIVTIRTTAGDITNAAL